MSVGIKRVVHLNYADAVKKTREELAKEGFGIITEIDVRKVMKEKLGFEHPNYVILGACNPKFAHDALHKDRNIGLFMPCNVIVYEEGKDVVVVAQEPTKIVELLGNDELKSFAAGVENLLRKAVERI